MDENQPPTVGFDEVMKLVQFKKETLTYDQSGSRFSFPVLEPSTIDLGTRVMVFAPHQDDEVLGCGGTIRHYARRSASIKVVYMTDGSFGGGEENDQELATIRRQEAKEGLLELGYLDSAFLDYPDTGLKCEPDVVVRVLELLEDFRPNKIFVPFLFELHPDHMEAAKIIAHALQWYPWHVECYNYEVWTPLLPNVVIDITETIDAKLNALSKHQSQLRIINYIDKIRGLNAYRSITAGKNVFYCEAFLKGSRQEQLYMAKRLGVI